MQKQAVLGIFESELKKGVSKAALIRFNLACIFSELKPIKEVIL